MRSEQGHDKLYKMGFDGACIEKLRHLTHSQYVDLLFILDKFQTAKHHGKSGHTSPDNPGR